LVIRSIQPALEAMRDVGIYRARVISAAAVLEDRVFADERWQGVCLE
jgi:hypothetical protein